MSVRTVYTPTEMPKAELFGIGFEPVLEYGGMSDIGSEGLSYYKGTACPVIPENNCDLKSHALEILVDMLKRGSSISEIGDNLIKQMDSIEETLRLADGGQTTRKAVQCVLDTFPGLKNRIGLMTIWYTNVHILLKIDRIKNDDMNGMLYKCVLKKN
tara:strand:- start:35 stop:505 length:471 start_codon:yes stop_codon:yes gene_type:complete